MDKVKVIACLLLLGSTAVPICPGQTVSVERKVSCMASRGERKEKKAEIPLYVSFGAGQTVVRPDYKNNQKQLAGIYNVIEKIANDSTFVLEAIQLCGFASPEGNYEYNTRLSFDRAQALKNYLLKRYPMQARLIEVGCKSEDWERLQALVVVSDLSCKQEIRSIITSVSDPDDREAWIWQIDDGTTYRILLNHYYPLLRRVECDILYRTIPFAAP